MKGILKKRKNAPVAAVAPVAAEAKGVSEKPPFVKNRYKRQKVALDALNWKSIDSVDGLDDFEGFFGLEEVEDVEVVKEGGLITFQAKETKPSPEKPTSETPVNDDEEWEGFSEGDNVTAPIPKEPNKEPSKEPSKEPNKEPNKEPKKEPKRKVDPTPKKKKSKSNATEDKALSDMSFKALDGQKVDEGVDTKRWAPLDLSPEILGSLSVMKFGKPTPIQSASIPAIIEGHDLIGKAQTGSGKTLAYGIPIVEKYLRDPSEFNPSKTTKGSTLALILAPTRELAHQISTHLTTLCSGFNGPRIATVTGGLSVQKQQRQLETAHIIIATPGRLWEVMQTSKAALGRLSEVKFLVLDEADRLLNDGHFEEIEQILNAIDRQDAKPKEDDESEKEDQAARPRQTLVFSATFHTGLQKKLGNKDRNAGDVLSQQESMAYLVKKLNFREEKPKFVDVNPKSQLADGIKEGLVECAGLEKVCIIVMGNPSALTYLGSLSLCYDNAPSSDQDTNLHELHFICQTPYAISPKPRLTSEPVAFDHAPKSSLTKYRTLFNSTVIHSRGYRCSSPWS
jgi:ATP-dependent RNA helicase DDX24/MAK5